MLLHDTCTVEFTEVIGDFEPGPARTYTVPGGVPCELTPLDSTAASASGPLQTRYTFFTNVDLVALADAQTAEWGGYDPPTMTITYHGKTLQPEAGFEIHRVLGRFHHIEAIVKDYGSLGV